MLSTTDSPEYFIINPDLYAKDGSLSNAKEQIETDEF